MPLVDVTDRELLIIRSCVKHVADHKHKSNTVPLIDDYVASVVEIERLSERLNTRPTRRPTITPNYPDEFPVLDR
jgi:hypothetical protein